MTSSDVDEMEPIAAGKRANSPLLLHPNGRVTSHLEPKSAEHVV
jgi:hypothetical protein